MFLDLFFIHLSNNNWFIIVFNYLNETLFHDHIKNSLKKQYNASYW